jgi:exosortase
MNSAAKSLGLESLSAGGARGIGFRILGFVLVCTLPFVLAGSTIRVLISLIRSNETFSQIPLIPLVSIFLILTDRKRVLAKLSFRWALGACVLPLGLMTVAAAKLNLLESGPNNRACLLMVGIVLAWMGTFALFFGADAFKAAIFPLCFLVFMIPIPEPVLSKTIYLLQEGSAYVAECFFKLAGVPYLRRDLVFVLPGVAIRVAEECSGIRSSLALLITTVLASYVFLRTSWKRILLCALVVPLAIFKNGLRIMTLSTLAIYVDPGFLYGNLHHHGGIVFFILALVPMIAVLLVLQKSEKARLTSNSQVGSARSPA